MRVIGTAGHVDHGKSTLVKALTGINPDRLKEEQAREMTIDLGFAWLALPSGEAVSVVDVPGHEDFIQNMLAGVGGIDAAVLVVAADEGVMPQTREHVAILDQLKVRAGLVAITKCDLAEDDEWLELVQLDVAGLIEGTALADAHIIPVSSRTGKGLGDLLAGLDRLLLETPVRPDLGQPRLSVDRVFSIAGFGTVVTGTLLDGRLRTGEEVEILPRRLRARIRSLQTNKTRVETATPGTRVAVNLSGVSTDELARGDTIARPDCYVPAMLVDARVTVLSDAPKALGHHADLKVFAGAAQVPARVRILGAEEIEPGESGWVQLRLAEPMVLAKNDRFIIRQPSPGLTVGGGIIVDAHPQRRHRRFRTETIERLEMLAHGTPEEILLEALRRHEPCAARELIHQCGLPVEVACESLALLRAAGQIAATNAEGRQLIGRELAASSHLVMSQSGWAAMADRLLDLLVEYHRQHPLRAGIPKEEVKSRLRVETRVFNDLVQTLAEEGRAISSEGILRIPGHKVKFSAQQQSAVDALLATFRKSPYTPPTIPEAQRIVNAEVFNALVDQGVLVKMDETICFLGRTYEGMVKRVVSHLTANGRLTVGEARDMFGSSRKYVLPFLDFLDQQRVTRRVGDDRVLRN